MKKTAVLGAVFFIILFRTFADENTVNFKNLYFNWLLFNYKTENQKSYFLNLNPIFFGNLKDYLLMNIFENTGQNNNSPNKRVENMKSQETGFCLLGSLILVTVSILQDSYLYNHRLEQNIYNDAWKQQKETEKFYQRIYPHNRNY
jgi:hypothetical protein